MPTAIRRNKKAAILNAIAGHKASFLRQGLRLFKISFILPVFYPIAFPLDFDHFTVMDEPVDDRRSNNVIVEYLAPVLEGSVAGKHDGAAFIAG